MQMQMTNQDRVWRDSARNAKEMDTLLCIPELKSMIVRSQDGRHKIIKSVEQFSFMIRTREEDRTLVLINLIITNNNPDTGIRIIRNPLKKLDSTQIETEIRIDSIITTDQATLGLID